MGATSQTAKVVILMVEGDNDEGLLAPYVEEVLNAKQTNYHFEITFGDLLGDSSNQAKAINIVDRKISEVLTKQKFLREDVVAFFYLVDVDGSFIPQGHFLVDEQLEINHRYDLKNERVYCSSQRMKQLNKKSWRKKYQRLRALAKVSQVSKIQYQLAFFSITSEHVLSGEVQYDQDAKLDVIDDFLDAYPKTSDFWTFLTQNQLVTPNDAWQILEQSTGFMRLTSVNQIFDALSQLE